MKRIGLLIWIAVSNLSCYAQTLTAEDAKIINTVFAENESCQERTVQLEIAMDSAKSVIAQKDSAISVYKYWVELARTEANLRNEQNIQLNGDIDRYKKVLKEKNWAAIKTTIGTAVGSFVLGSGITTMIFLLK
jgi:hypothetical protein